MRQHLTLMTVIALMATLFSITAFAQRPELSVQTGHAGSIVSLAFTRDGKVLASGSVDNTIKLWDTATGHQLRALKGHDMTVVSLAFSPDDRLLASGGADNTIKLWDLAAGQEKQTLRGHTLYVSAISFSPDGKLLVSASADQKIKLWEVATGREVRTIAAGTNPDYSLGLRVLFSGDGKTLFSSGETVKQWDVRSGNELRTIKVEKPNTDPNRPISIPNFPIALGVNGTVLAIGGKAIELWDVATGKLLRTLPGQASVIVFSPDGLNLAGCDRTEIKLWNIKTGQELRTWEGAQLGIEVIAYGPDNKTLASGNGDHTVTLWDAAKGEERLVLNGHSAPITSLMLSADGRVLSHGVVGRLFSKDSVKIWDPTTGQLVRSLDDSDDQVYSVSLSDDGTRLTAAGPMNSIGLWDVAQGLQLNKFKSTGDPHFSPHQVVLSRDGRFVAASGNDVTKVFEVNSGRELFTFKGQRNGIWSLAISPNNDTLATGASDHTIKLWSIATGKEIKTLTQHAGGVGALAFSPDGKRLASGSHDKTTLVWNIASGQPEDGFAESSGWVDTVAFSHDGRKVASGGDEGVIRVWEIGSGKPALLTLKGHTERLNSILFTADDRLLLSGSSDGSIKLWDLTTGKELASLFTLDHQDWLVITPDGLFDGSPSAWSQILWRFSANLFDVAPAEVFFNEFYYPGLLADLIAGKRPAATQSLEQKDRRQPAVVLGLAPGQPTATAVTARRASVKIEVTSALAGAKDVRLFRNGALVKAWHGDVLKGQSRATLSAEVPIVAGPNRLTAYAFNRDNVKSTDATLTITGADSLKRAGTLFILAVAVNKYANSQFDLQFAVADATAFAAELQRQEVKLNNYGRAEIISLLDAEATKANIVQALTKLAAQAQPEDAVVVYFAGHGTAQQNQFFLIPHDLGYSGARSKIDAAGLQTILAHSISDRELEHAFEGVDAGQLLLVIDACNSGQALEAEEKRRGPMNSRGLAQLAYEKGMYVLTGAQSYQAALEASKLGHGYLTYALVEEGLKTAAADIQPRDGKVLLREWLDYATQRVPQMQADKIKEAKGRQLAQVVAFVPGEEKTDPAKRNLQRPRVFYRRELEAEPFIVASPGKPQP